MPASTPTDAEMEAAAVKIQALHRGRMARRATATNPPKAKAKAKMKAKAKSRGTRQKKRARNATYAGEDENDDEDDDDSDGASKDDSIESDSEESDTPIRSASRAQKSAKKLPAEAAAIKIQAVHRGRMARRAIAPKFKAKAKAKAKWKAKAKNKGKKNKKRKAAASSDDDEDEEDEEEEESDDTSEDDATESASDDEEESEDESESEEAETQTRPKKKLGVVGKSARMSVRPARKKVSKATAGSEVRSEGERDSASEDDSEMESDDEDDSADAAPKKVQKKAKQKAKSKTRSKSKPTRNLIRKVEPGDAAELFPVVGKRIQIEERMAEDPNDKSDVTAASKVDDTVTADENTSARTHAEVDAEHLRVHAEEQGWKVTPRLFAHVAPCASEGDEKEVVAVDPALGIQERGADSPTPETLSAVDPALDIQERGVDSPKAEIPGAVDHALDIKERGADSPKPETPSVELGQTGAGVAVEDATVPNLEESPSELAGPQSFYDNNLAGGDHCRGEAVRVQDLTASIGDIPPKGHAILTSASGPSETSQHANDDEGDSEIVGIHNGRPVIGGSCEIPLIMNFKGRDERLIVWRNRKHWVMKPEKHGSEESWPPQCAAVTQITPGERPKRKQATKSASAPTLPRSTTPLDGDQEEDIDLPPAAGAIHAHYAKRAAAKHNTKQKANRKPAGNQPASGQSGQAGGPWKPSWGQQTRSHPPLRSDGRAASVVPGKYDREIARAGLAQVRREFRRTGKEMGIVARAMMEPPAKPGSVLEDVLEQRRRGAAEATRKADIFEAALEDGGSPTTSLPKLPVNVTRLLKGPAPLPPLLPYRPFAGLSTEQITNRAIDAIRLPEIRPGEI